MSSAGTAEIARTWTGEFTDRRGFDRMVAAALDSGRGFAAGKLGVSERGWLLRPMVAEREPDDRRRRAHAVAVAHRSQMTAGVFPTDAAFQARWEGAFAAAVAELDAIGILDPAVAETAAIFRRYDLRGAAMLYKDQEPERSVPADEEACWLRHLRGRRVLLVSPFADLLCERASRDTYEAVWSRIGKRWFEPASVAGVQMPYGYVPETRRRYGTSLELLEEMGDRLEGEEFDVALISAGGLGIPLAVAAKRLGRVGLSLGGHLQVMFGVHGQRWLDRAGWRERYFNDSWIRPPAAYVPDPETTTENYW